MIQKILRITDVGVVNTRSAVDLAPLTIIYGENGRGKTTLAAVLRSLTSSDPTYILERRRTVGNPEVALLIDDGAASFSGAWTGPTPLVDVFDSRFISENIYSGPIVDHEHRRSLHGFAMGREGVELASRVEGLDGEIRELNSAIAGQGRVISARIEGRLDLDAFLALPSLQDIEQYVSEQRGKVARIERAAAISTHPALESLMPPALDLERVEELLGRTLSELAADAEARTRHHIDTCLGRGGEEWLERGTRFPVQDTCPYCGRGTEGSDLIAAFRAYFSDAYHRFRVELQTRSTAIQRDFAESAIERLIATINSNSAHADFWAELDVIPPAPPDTGEVRNAAGAVRAALKEVLTRKVASPLDPEPLGEDLNAAADLFSKLLDQLSAYNREVAEANAAISEKKAQAEGEELPAAQRVLRLLSNIRARHNEPVATECREYEDLCAGMESKELEKKAAKEALDTYTERLFRGMQESINRHLAASGCGYSIRGVRTRYVGGRPRTDYQIVIGGQAIDLSPPQSAPAGTPSFRTTLSEGDKSALAFAFFLSRLELKSDLADHIVVFDDPMTSLDENRKHHTLQQILRIAPSTRQVIVLTHDIYFARRLLDLANRRRLDGTVQSLRLRHGAGSLSELEVFDLTAATRGDYFDRYFKARAFLDGAGGDAADAARVIRPLLEHNLRVRFPRVFGPSTTLGEMIGQVRSARAMEPAFEVRPLLFELSELNDFVVRLNHDDEIASADPPTETEIRGAIERTLEVLGGVSVAAS